MEVKVESGLWHGIHTLKMAMISYVWLIGHKPFHSTHYLASRLDSKISIKSKKEHFKPKIYIFLTFMLIKILVRTLQGIDTETLFVLPMKI